MDNLSGQKLLSSPNTPSTCQICLNEFSQSSDSPFQQSQYLSCSHFISSVCLSCADTWITEKLLFINSTNENSIWIKCPIESCISGINLRESLKCVSLKKLPKSNEQLFINYCRQTQDIISCPNQACGYKGFADKNNISCKQEFVCEACQFQWKNPNQVIQNGLFSGLSQKLKDVKNYLYLHFHTKSCPTCSSPISKRGGCNQITCSQCSSSFCWNCLEEHSNKHVISMKCSLKVGIKAACLSSPVFWVFKKAGFFDFTKSVEFIKKPNKWYEYIGYPFQMIGVSFRIAVFCGFLLSMSAVAVSGVDIIRQTIANQKNTEKKESQKVPVTRTIYKYEKPSTIFGFSAMIFLVTGCLTKILGNANETKAMLGAAALSISVGSSILMSSSF